MQQKVKPYFGMNLNLKPGLLTFPSLVPFGSYRFWDNETDWPQLNPAEGTFNYKTLDW